MTLCPLSTPAAPASASHSRSLSDLDGLALGHILDAGEAELTDAFLQSGCRALVRAGLNPTSREMGLRAHRAVQACAEPQDLRRLLDNPRAAAALRGLAACDVPAPKQLSVALQGALARALPQTLYATQSENAEGLEAATSQALAEQASLGGRLLDLVDGPTDGLCAWLWRGVVASLHEADIETLTRGGRQFAAAAQRARILSFNVRVDTSFAQLSEQRAHFINDSPFSFSATQMGNLLQVHPFSSHLPPALAFSLAPTHLEGLVMSWDPIDTRQRFDQVSAGDAVAFLRAQTSLRLLDLTNLGAGQAVLSAAKLVAGMWRSEPLFLATLNELRIDGSVREDETEGVVPLVAGVPRHLPHLRRLHLGTLVLRRAVAKEAFFAALGGAAGQLEALTLTQAEGWIKDAATAMRLGALLAPIPSLSLRPFNARADLALLGVAHTAHADARRAMARPPPENGQAPSV